MASDSLGCRAPEGLATQYDDAASECGALKAEIIRRALRYYADTNPDGIGAFAADDEVREDRLDASELVEDEGGEEEPGVGGRSSSVYDPTGDV